MKVGDLVRYRTKKFVATGIILSGITDEKPFCIEVYVLDNDDEMFKRNLWWDISHWELFNESG